MSENDSSKIIIAVKVAAAIIILIALLFGPAGTFNWPEAWCFLFLYFLFVGAVGVWMKKNDPELLKERMSANKKKNVKGWDRWIMGTFTLLTLVLFAVAGLDAVRFRWSQVPFALKALGFVGFIPAVILIFQVMKENTYLSEVVRIQEERGHKVCTTGPYRYVRHPMYVGIILFLLSLPLFLGSFYALIPAVLSIFLFFFRTSLEDKTLQKELPGYQEYAQKVRYKLIPGVW